MISLMSLSGKENGQTLQLQEVKQKTYESLVKNTPNVSSIFIIPIVKHFSNQKAPSLASSNPSSFSSDTAVRPKKPPSEASHAVQRAEWFLCAVRKGALGQRSRAEQEGVLFLEGRRTLV